MPLARFVASRVDRFLGGSLLGGPGLPVFDFLSPPGEPALTAPDSVSWQVFRNPLALYVGGIAAVLLELAEPRVRSGVWDHTTFRTDPVSRMRRTGLAAMITVYGARSAAEGMIAGVRKMHERVRGVTPAGIPYRADDPELLLWVHATALYGFLEAFVRFVRPLNTRQQDAFVAEGVEAARLYGVTDPPSSRRELSEIFEAMRPRLEASEILSEFLTILSRLPLVPLLLRPLGMCAIRGAVGILPSGWADDLRIGARFRPGFFSPRLLGWAGRLLDRMPLPSSPASRAATRLAAAGGKSGGPALESCVGTPARYE